MRCEVSTAVQSADSSSGPATGVMVRRIAAVEPLQSADSSSGPATGVMVRRIAAVEPLQEVTRLVIVDENGRRSDEWNVKVALSIQDDGRTLKVFVSK